MELQEFTAALEGMSANDIHAVSAGLVAFTQSAADEVATWNAILTVDRELRRCRRTREAASASCRAARAVQAAATHAHIPLPDDDVTRVARAAGDIVRGLIVLSEITPQVVHLLESWQVLFFPGATSRSRFSSAA
jgi:hypothetical protein